MSFYAVLWKSKFSDYRLPEGEKLVSAELTLSHTMVGLLGAIIGKRAKESGRRLRAATNA